MIQPRLFRDEDADDRWVSAVLPYRPPRSAGMWGRKPLVGQTRFPGMDWDGRVGALRVRLGRDQWSGRLWSRPETKTPQRGA